MERSILEEIDDQGIDPTMSEQCGLEQPSAGSGSGLKVDLGILKVKTGSGSVESYIDHPLNFTKSKGLGQMIRGLTGLLGDLDLALVDVFVGLMQFAKERKAGPVNVN